MNDQAKLAVPTWFWIVGGLALVWNLMGVFAFYLDMTMTEAALAELSDAQQASYQNMPIWAKVAFGGAVICGALGAVALLMRRSIAIVLFSASLAAILVQMFNAFALQNGLEVFGPGSAVMPAMIVLIGMLLLWFSNRATARGWLQ